MSISPQYIVNYISVYKLLIYGIIIAFNKKSVMLIKVKLRNLLKKGKKR